MQKPDIEHRFVHCSFVQSKLEGTGGSGFSVEKHLKRMSFRVRPSLIQRNYHIRRHIRYPVLAWCKDVFWLTLSDMQPTMRAAPRIHLVTNVVV